VPNLLGNGEVHEAEVINEDAGTRRELESLRADLKDLRNTYGRDRQQLLSMLNGLRALFGKNDGTTVQSTTPDKWDAIKSKFGGKMAQIIEALQLSGSANRTQLKKMTGGAMATVDQAVYKLRDMGLIVKDGDQWRLKT